MELYNVLRPVHRISRAVGLAPYIMEARARNIVFRPGQPRRFKHTLRAVFYGVNAVLATTCYLVGQHRPPMQTGPESATHSHNLTNRLLLYLADCSAYVIVMAACLQPYVREPEIARALGTAAAVHNKLNQLDVHVTFPHKRTVYGAALVLFSTDISLKLYDMACLVRGNLLSLHEIYEHLARYTFIAFMDLLILQWICYITFIKSYFKSLMILRKRIKYDHCWLVSDFKINNHNTNTHATLRDIGKLYDKLCGAAKRVNSDYSLTILLMIPVSFIITTVAVFSLCKIFKSGDQINPFTTIAYVSYMFRIAGFVVPAISTVELANVFSARLHALNADCSYENDCTEAMRALALQVHHQRLTFSPFGVFPLDGFLVCAIVGALITYMVVLVQFEVA